MGHLGNPISFRLSYKKVWDNYWFIKNLYYPEFINSMINLKDFMYYFLSRKFVLFSGLSLSHLFIFKFYKSFIFKMYIYHIDLEKNTVLILNGIFEMYYKKIYEKTWGCLKTKKKMDLVFKQLHNADAYCFIFLCYLYFYKPKKINYYLKYNNLFNRKYEYFFYKKKILYMLKYFILFKIIQEKKKKIIKCRSFKKFKKIYFRVLDYWRKKKYTKDSEFYLNIKYIKDTFKANIRNLNGLKNLYKYLKTKNSISLLNKKKLLNRKGDRILLDQRIIKKKFNFSVIFFILYFLKKNKFKKYKTYINFDKKWTKMLKFLNIYKYMSNKNLHIINAFRFLGIFLISLYKKKKIKAKRFNFRACIYKFLYHYLYSKYTKKFMFIYFNILKYYLCIINSRIKNIIYHIYFISNSVVSARFIGRYLALRLRRNANLKRLIFTIKKQLNKLMWFNKRKPIYKLHNYKLLMQSQIKRYKIWFKKLYFFFLLLLKNRIYLLLQQNDFLGIFYIYYYQKYVNINIKTLILYNLMMEIFDLFYLFKNKFIFNLKFYNAELNIIFNKFVNLFSLKSILIYKKKINNNILVISTFFYKNYMAFAYLKFIVSNYLKINLRNIRKNYYPKYYMKLKGFKLYFKGRFSRKQRASKVWLQQGKIPFNTLKINIDYALCTIPLKNSLISIKLWLYRNRNFHFGVYKKFIQI